MDPDPHPFFLHQLLKYGNKWCEDNPICVKMFIMDMFQERQWEDAVNYDWTVNIIRKQLYLMHAISMRTRSLTYLITIIKYAFAVVSKTRKHPIAKLYEGIEQMHIHMVFCLIQNATKLLPRLTLKEKEEFKKLVSHYIRFTSSTVSRFPGVTTLLQRAFLMPGMFSIELIQLFLEAGANPNCTDEKGDTPLHYFGKNIYDKKYSNNNFEELKTAIQLMVAAGAHLDHANNWGSTPLEIFRILQLRMDLEGRREPSFCFLTNTILPLKCYCAQVIRAKKIPFDESQLPSSLISFVQFH